MPAFLHSLSITIAVILAYFWLQTPLLVPYALQAFGLTILIYFISKRLAKAHILHIAPSSASIEMPLLTFAFLLLIGATGNYNSFFYPFSYVHLFFLVLSAEISTAVVATSLVMLFHYGMAPAFSWDHLSHVLSLPVVLIFFLFAKSQYEQANQQQDLLISEEHVMDDQRQQSGHLNQFIQKFLQPKIAYLQQLAHHPQHNQATLQGQLALIALEIERVLSTKPPKNKSANDL